MIDWLVNNPEFFIGFFGIFGFLFAYALWCWVVDGFRKMDEMEHEIDRSPHMTKVGNGHLYVIHPDFYNQDGGDAA